jgi:hypothetical protein
MTREQFLAWEKAQELRYIFDGFQPAAMTARNHEYAAIASVRRYIVLAQDEMAGTMFERIGDD